MPDFKSKMNAKSYTGLNTRLFFEKTAHFASLSRAMFQLINFPTCLDINVINKSESYNEDQLNMINIAKNLLSTGIMAKSVTLPQQSLMLDNGFSYGGPTRKHPLGQQFSDIDVEFLLMGSNIKEARSIYYFFTEWQKLIAGPRNIRSEEVPRSDSTAFAVDYYDNYVAEADITIFSPSATTREPLVGTDTDPVVPTGLYPEDKFLASIISNKYSELYPISIGSLFTSWDSADTPASLPITFGYYYSTTRATYSTP